MKEAYPITMQTEYNSELKTILMFYDKNVNKKSKMTIYHIFEGLDLVYNKFNTFESPEPSKKTSKTYIEINFCKRGVFECIVNEDKYLYLTEGEMAANLTKINRKKSGFPLGYYEGIELLIDVEKLRNSIPSMFFDLIKNIEYLNQVLNENEDGIILKPVKEMIHIFDELYLLNPEIEMIHTRLKILELLLVFTVIPLKDIHNRKQYLDKSQISKIKLIHNELISNLDEKITIDELSKKYKIGTTPLKIFFKEMYGKPIHTYLKNYRIHVALHLLEETNESITEIAGMLGYDNSSKFSEVFKDKVGCTPVQYRKQKVHLEHERLFGVEIED